MKKIIIITLVIVPVLMLMAGCGGPNDFADNSNVREERIHVNITDDAALIQAYTEQQRMWMEQGERSKQSMYNTIDQMFGIPPSRPYEPYGHHRH